MLLRLARQTLGREPGEIAGPPLLASLAELAQILPRVETGRMAVVKKETDGIVADRLDFHDAHVAFPGDRDLLAGTVPLDLSTRALDSKLLRGEGERLPA